MSSSKRILQNTSYLYLRILISMFVSILTTRLILNSLGISDFGIFNIIGGAIAMLGFVNSSMASATQRFMSYAEGEGKKEKKIIIFNVGLILHFGISLFVGLLLIIASKFFFDGILNIPPDRLMAAKVVYGSLVISTMLTIMNVPYEAVMTAHENMLFYSMVGVLESFLKLIVAVVCVYTLYDKLIIYGLLMACIPAIILVIMRWYCHCHYQECLINLRRYWDGATIKDMAKFAGWNFFGSFSALISGHGSNLLLNHFFGPALNAANGICGQMNAYMQSFSNTLIKALNPVLVKSEGGHQREKMYIFAFTGAKLSVCLYALFAIPIIIDRDYILELWLKIVPPYTSEFIGYVLVWTFLSQIGGTLSTTINAIGRIKEVRMINGFLNLLILLFIYVAFKLGLPPQSMLIISCLLSAIQLIVVIIYNKIYGKMSVFGYLNNVLFRVLLSIGGAYWLTLLIWQNMGVSFMRLIVTIVVSTLIYTILFYRVGLVRIERKVFCDQVVTIVNHARSKL